MRWFLCTYPLHSPHCPRIPSYPLIWNQAPKRVLQRTTPCAKAPVLHRRGVWDRFSRHGGPRPTSEGMTPGPLGPDPRTSGRCAAIIHFLGPVLFAALGRLCNAHNHAPPRPMTHDSVRRNHPQPHVHPLCIPPSLPLAPHPKHIPFSLGSHRIPGGGNLKFDTCDIWNREIWCRENLAPILKYHLGPNSQILAQEADAGNGGPCFPGLWLVAVIPCSYRRMYCSGSHSPAKGSLLSKLHGYKYKMHPRT